MPRREERKFNFIYKTINLLTNKFYIGMHSTNNLEDNYLGSGKRLRYSIRKYGEENHKIERIEFFKTRKELRNREIEIINENLIKDPLCMNLKEGGDGGFTNEEHRKKCTMAGLKSQWSNSEYMEWHKNRQRERFIQLNKNKIDGWGFKNKKHSIETKLQMGIKHKGHKYQNGEKNSQFGTRWITNEEKNKKIKSEDLIPEGWKLGRKIK